MERHVRHVLRRWDEILNQTAVTSRNVECMLMFQVLAEDCVVVDPLFVKRVHHHLRRENGAWPR
jgi:hypothetical protein